MPAPTYDWALPAVAFDKPPKSTGGAPDLGVAPNAAAIALAERPDITLPVFAPAAAQAVGG